MQGVVHDIVKAFSLSPKYRVGMFSWISRQGSFDNVLFFVLLEAARSHGISNDNQFDLPNFQKQTLMRKIAKRVLRCAKTFCLGICYFLRLKYKVIMNA